MKFSLMRAFLLATLIPLSCCGPASSALAAESGHPRQAGIPQAAQHIPDVRIGGGPKDGQYIHFADATCKVLGKLFECDSQVSAGSGANVENLRKSWEDPGAVDVAFMKGNMAEAMQKEPDFGDRYDFIRYVAGEAALLVVSNKYYPGSLPNWEAVRKNVHLLKIGLPGEKSGDAAVFKALSGVDGSVLTKFKEVRYYQDRTTMIKAVQKGEIHAGWLVQYVNPDNAAIEMVNADGSGVSFMGVVDEAFIAVSPSVDVQEVPVTNAKWFGMSPPKTVLTTTMKAAIVARSPKQYPDGSGRRDTQESVVQALRGAKEEALLPDVPWVKALVNSASLKASGKVSSIIAEMQSTARKVTAQF